MFKMGCSDFEMKCDSAAWAFCGTVKFKEAIMTSHPTDPQDKSDNLHCPECRALLKKRKTRNPDECEMVCGGCGQTFDICDLETVEKLKK